MDNAAGICAWRHCRTNIVTAVLDTLDFEAPVKKGSLVTVEAHSTFSSSRSLEVEVHVTAESPLTGEKYNAAVGFLTFVSLDEHGRPLELPALPEPVNERERATREAGAARYASRKLAR